MRSASALGISSPSWVGRSPGFASLALASSLLAAGCGGRLGGAVDTVLRRPAAAVAPPPPGALGSPYVYCDAELARRGIDVEAENAPAIAEAKRLASAREGKGEGFDVIIVPGYVPLGEVEGKPGVHPVAEDRLRVASADFRAGLAPLLLVSGGNVHPDGTPFNEALEMKRFLVASGVPASRVLVEPCARHSHTNLRNAGRLMLSLGLSRALVVSSWDQSSYFGRPRISSFDARCLADLGYLVGALSRIDDRRTLFLPSGRNFERGPDPRDP